MNQIGRTGGLYRQNSGKRVQDASPVSNSGHEAGGDVKCVLGKQQGPWINRR